MKPYRIVARLYNNRLWRAVTDLYPHVVTQKQAAAQLGINYITFNRLMTMRCWPKGKGGDWWKIATKIADAVVYPPEYLFDETLYGRKPDVATMEIDARDLPALGLLSLPPAPDEVVERSEVAEEVEKAVQCLAPREQRVR